MNRFDFLRRGISSEHGVLEIGPYFSPIAPRAAGFKTTTLDLYSHVTDTMQEDAAAKLDHALGGAIRAARA